MTNEAHAPLNLGRVADAESGTDSPGSAQASALSTPEPEGVVAQEAREAEVEAYRRRLLKEMDEHEVKARQTMMLDFLEIADNLERATAAWKDGGVKSRESVQEGIDAVLRLFQSKLERYGVTAIEAEGKPFDPTVHHAVSQSTSTDTTPGTVLQEVQKGYWMDGRLLRPAAVVVASAPAKAAEVDAPDDEGGSNDDPADDWRGYQRNRR
jgi:molecular chaperone GrpE